MLQGLRERIRVWADAVEKRADSGMLSERNRKGTAWRMLARFGVVLAGGIGIGLAIASELGVCG